MIIRESKFMSLINDRINELQNLLSDFEKNVSEPLFNISNIIADTFRSGNKILICGNGGSAADAQHFAAEFINVFSKEIKRPGLPAISLASDTSVITAIANDNNYEQIFARQVEALGNVNDILIVITTSGSSKNCIKALQTAKDLGLKTIAITRSKAEVSLISDLSIEVPSENTQLIQACHLFAYHTVVELVEQILYTSKGVRT
jgi:D-sedoheptulose 7-phosphate isomerase